MTKKITVKQWQKMDKDGETFKVCIFCPKRFLSKEFVESYEGFFEEDQSPAMKVAKLFGDTSSVIFNNFFTNASGAFGVIFLLSKWTDLDIEEWHHFPEESPDKDQPILILTDNTLRLDNMPIKESEFYFKRILRERRL